jgi:dipeptidyl aminopeptidase/acylaminoacyl peptidase
LCRKRPNNPVADGVPENLNLEVGEDLRFSPDGRRIAFTRTEGQRVAEVWVMENFLPGAEAAAPATVKK